MFLLCFSKSPGAGESEIFRKLVFQEECNELQ